MRRLRTPPISKSCVSGPCLVCKSLKAAADPKLLVGRGAPLAGLTVLR